MQNLGTIHGVLIEFSSIFGARPTSVRSARVSVRRPRSPSRAYWCRPRCSLVLVGFERRSSCSILSLLCRSFPAARRCAAPPPVLISLSAARADLRLLFSLAASLSYPLAAAVLLVLCQHREPARPAPRAGPRGVQGVPPHWPRITIGLTPYSVLVLVYIRMWASTTQI